MKRAEVDQIAHEIWRHMVKGTRDVPFSELRKETRAFYRKIARWHLKKVGKNNGQTAENNLASTGV